MEKIRIEKASKLNVEDLQQQYYSIRKTEFTWLDTSEFSLIDFDVHTEGELVYIATIDGDLAGFISIWEQDNFVHNLFVNSKFRRLNVAKKINQPHD